MRVSTSLRTIFGLLLVAVIAIATPAALVAAQSPVPALSPILPEYAAEFEARMDSFPTYQFDVALDDAQSSIGGSVLVTFPNETGTTLSEIPFRLYPNAAYYDEGETSIGAVLVDGVAVDTRFDDSGTVLFVDLPDSLAPGESVATAIDFTTVAPTNAGGSFGILNHDLESNRFVLADWYPVIAGWDDTGWRLEPPTEQGDPTFSATSIFDLQLGVPDGYDVFATGDETRFADGTIHIETGPVREFALVAAQGIETRSALAGETTVSVHVDPAYAGNGQHMLDIAVAALDFYNGAFGAYPYRQLDIVETDLSLAYGVSWSGVLFINETQLALGPDNLATLDFTIFHEIGHQWWGSTVGANSNDHTFMVEGLTNATALLAQAAIQGPEAATNSLYAWMVTPYLNLLAGSGDAVADVSIFDQPATAPLSTLAYGKGAIGFLAIRNQIGDAAFREALATYADHFRLGIAEPTDLLNAFETASGQSLKELWSFWFDSAVTTPADVEALVSEIIASLG